MNPRFVMMLLVTACGIGFAVYVNSELKRAHAPAKLVGFGPFAEKGTAPQPRQTHLDQQRAKREMPVKDHEREPVEMIARGSPQHPQDALDGAALARLRALSVKREPAADCGTSWTDMHGMTQQILNEPLHDLSAYPEGSSNADRGWSPLIVAIRGNDVPGALALIGEGTSLEAPSRHGGTPLHFAADAGQVEVVEALLRAGVNVNARDNNRHTPLMIAVTHANPKVVAQLLEAGAQLEERDRLNRTPLMLAAISKQGSNAGVLLAAGANPRAWGLWDSSGGSMNTIDAARSNMSSDIERQIQVAVSAQSSEDSALEARDDAGNTPLHWVAQYGNASVALRLIGQGADLEALTCRARPTDANDENGPHRYDARLATPLLIAMNSDEVAVARVLINAGARANARDERGRGALHLIQSKEGLALVPLLIEKGADPNAKDREGKTPADVLAAMGLRGDFTEQARQAGVSVAATEPSAEELFATIERMTFGRESAEQKDDPAKIAAILDRAPQLIHARNEYGKTPLHVAAFYYGLQKTIRFLVSRGASVSAVDKRGRTPIFQTTDFATIRLLVSLGADVNARDNSGSTPLHLSASSDYSLPQVKALVEVGARGNLKDNSGQTPLDVARASGHEDIAAFLTSAGR